MKSIGIYSKKWLDWSTRLTVSPENIRSMESLLKTSSDLNIHNTYHCGQIYILMSMLGYKPESQDVFLYNDADK